MNDVNALDHDLDNALDDGAFEFDDGGVLSLDSKKYATNLIWLTTDESDAQSSVSKKASAIGADYYCPRLYVQQNGYGRLKLGHRMGMPSLAATVADVLVGEWHGAFKVDDGWLYMAVHADHLAPDGDRFFTIEEEAYNHFVAQAKTHKWPKTYVPENWNVKNNDGEIDLIDIIGDIPPATLKPVNLDALFGGAANKNMAVIVVGGVLLVVLLLMTSQAMLTNLLPQRLDDPVLATDTSRSLVAPPKQAAGEVDPLQALLDREQLPEPTKTLVTCVENFDDLMIPIPGWDVERMRCRGNFVEAVWGRGVGTLEMLQSGLGQFPFGVSKTYGSSGKFLASRVINVTSEDMKDIKLSQREQALVLLNNRLSALGSLTVRDVLPQRANNRNRSNNNRRGNAEVEQQRQLTLNDIPALSAVLNTDMPPEVIKENVNIPGLKFNMIEWNMRNSSWVYDMQIYLFPENYVAREGV